MQKEFLLGIKVGAANGAKINNIMHWVSFSRAPIRIGSLSI
jgi:hypothetical protein